jgi:hypothetical protein
VSFSVVNATLTHSLRNRSSAPDVSLISLKEPPAAAHIKLDSPSERSPNGKDGQEQALCRPAMAPLASSDPLADSLQPVLTSLDPSITPRPSHAAKRPPQVSSSRSSSPSPRGRLRRGRPIMRGWGGKQPAGRGRGRGRGRGSKHLVTQGVGYQVQSPSSTDLTDVEEPAKSPDRAAESRNRTTRENSTSTENDSRRSFSVSCVRETPSVCAPSPSGGAKPAIHALSPRDTIMPDPTTLVSQLNLTQQQHQLSSSILPNLGTDPLSTAFESHSYLSGLEDSGSGIKFLGDIEQVLDGHFLQSLTRGLYGSSTGSCLDSDLLAM